MLSELLLQGSLRVQLPFQDENGISLYTFDIMNDDMVTASRATVHVLDELHTKLMDKLIAAIRAAIRTHRADIERHQTAMTELPENDRAKIARHVHAIRRNKSIAIGLESMLADHLAGGTDAEEA